MRTIPLQKLNGGRPICFTHPYYELFKMLQSINLYKLRHLQVRPQSGGSSACGVEDFPEACECKEECKIDTPVAHKGDMDETVATVSIDDRRKMEDEIRGQQLEARQRGGVRARARCGAAATRVAAAQFILRRRGSNPGEGTQALPLVGGTACWRRWATCSTSKI